MTVQRGITQPVKVGEFTLHPGGHKGKGASRCIVSPSPATYAIVTVLKAGETVYLMCV